MTIFCATISSQTYSWEAIKNEMIFVLFFILGSVYYVTIDRKALQNINFHDFSHQGFTSLQTHHQKSAFNNRFPLVNYTSLQKNGNTLFGGLPGPKMGSTHLLCTSSHQHGHWPHVFRSRGPLTKCCVSFGGECNVLFWSFTRYHCL